MNTNNVVSAPAAANLTGKEHLVVKMTATGIDIATSADGAILVGTLMRAQPYQEDGVYAGKSVAVFRLHAGVHYVVMGASTAAVAQGAWLYLDPANPGKFIPTGTPPGIAIAWDAFTSANGAVVRAVFI
jgi:hypothetical protein